MKKQCVISALFLSALFLVTACSPKSMMSEEIAPFAYDSFEPAAGSPAMEDGEYSSRGESNYSGQAVQVERIVIRNADLTIVVPDPVETLEFISTIPTKLGDGFIVSSNIYKTYTRNGLEVPEGNITIRIPAEALDQALDMIKDQVEGKDEDVINENVSGRDVTQEYTDLKSRLRNLENAEEQLREIMASAVKTEDVLKIYNELTRVREEIEVLKGQINYYDEASRLSSISVYIRAQESIEPITIGKWEPVGIAQDALQALVDALKFIVNVLIWLVLFLAPLGLIIFFPLRWMIRMIKKSNAQRKARKAVKQTNELPEEIKK
jgi:hypothetical protein